MPPKAASQKQSCIPTPAKWESQKSTGPRPSSLKYESKGIPMGSELGFKMLAGKWRPAWMGKPYSIDLRERVQAEVEGGQSRRAAARRYNVGASFAVKLVDLVSRTGSAQPARQGRPPGGGKMGPPLTALARGGGGRPGITTPGTAAQLKA